MKKISLLVLVSLISITSFGQAQIEPHDSFATAYEFSKGYEDYYNFYGSLSEADSSDFLRWDRANMLGTIKVEMYVRNYSADTAYFTIDVYDGRKDGGLMFTKIVKVLPNREGYPTFEICNPANDLYYFNFKCPKSLDYRVFQYAEVPVFETNESAANNDTRSNAIQITGLNDLAKGALGYVYQGNDHDIVDFYKSTMIAGNLAERKLKIRTKNLDCAPGTTTTNYNVYKNNENTPFASGSIVNNELLEFKDVDIPLNNLQSGDAVFIKLAGQDAVFYEMKIYDGDDYGDIEPNDEYYNAVMLLKDTDKKGNVGYTEYDSENDSYVTRDEYDTYKITLLQPATVTLNLTAIPLNCDLPNEQLSVYYQVLSSDGYQKYYDQLLLQNGNPVCNEPLTNSVTLPMLNAGTYYIKISSDYNNINRGAWINYSLSYNSVEIESPDPEPNDDIATAVPTIPNKTYNGHVGPYEFDPQDTYQFIMPFAGAANFTFQASNDTCGGKSLLKYFVFDESGNYADYGTRVFEWDENAPCDSVQTRQIKIRALESGNYYLQLFSEDRDYSIIGNPKMSVVKGAIPVDYPVTYNFSYQFMDEAHADAEPNNDNDHAIPVSPGEVKKGYTGFYKANYSTDGVDYYSLTLPNPGNIDLIIKSTSRSNYETYNSTRNGVFGISAQNTSFLNARIPDYTKVEIAYPDSSYLDTLHICGVGEGPFIISIAGLGEYEFHFEMKDEITGINEIEPNDIRSKSQIFGDSSLIKGTISYFENNTYDVLDNFKIPVYDSDPITIYVKARNTQCAVKAGYYTSIGLKGYNTAGTNVVSKNIANNLNVAPGETIYDTITFNMAAPDTLFLEWSTYNKNLFEYEFFTNAFKPTPLFKLTGDTTVCLGSQQYIAANINQKNLTYHWSLPEGGGTITWVDSVATVTWTQAGSFPIELYLSNSKGNSVTKTQDIIVNDAQPPVAPDIFNFARNLSTSLLPPGTTVQWYRNGTPIESATDSVYYAALAGNYTARFINDCGLGPISNPYNFPADAGTQSISFPGVPDMQMAPQLKIKISATASSGLPVFYSLVKGPGTISNDSLIINGVGKIIIKGEQPGNDDYKAADEKYDTITVIKGNQVITVNPIPDQFYRAVNVYPVASSSAGLLVDYSIISGNAVAGYYVGSGYVIGLHGVGTITVQVFQAGDANYNAATPIQQTFCVGIDTLPEIKGASASCLGTYTYTAQKITGANYVWTLSGGGTIVTHNDTAFVTWTTTGKHTLNVKANSDCNVFYGSAPELSITVANVVPTQINNMVPVNGAVGQSLPLLLSWVPGQYTETYDLYVWDSTTSRPAAPYKKDLTGISFTIPQNAFPYDAAYKWQLVSKNPCNQTSGPVQSFRLVPLPDLNVTQVLAPITAISGQTISITWTVKNDGPGASLATQNWQDNVYLSFDNTPNLDVPPNTNPGGWSMLDFPVKPLLIASKTNVTALQPGEQYSNTINFTLPVNYSVPLYVFVRVNNNKSIVETAYDNNTDSAAKPIAITLAPTPDLRVDSVFTPNTVFSGAYINVAYKVKNYGALTPAGSVWKDEVYISQSQLFDSATAIKLRVLTLNDSYYPADEAANFINTQLQQDSGYHVGILAVIPNFIFGQWYIHVKTNTDHRLYEGPSFGNNTNSNAVQVYLTPTPHLIVNSITLPVSEASTTQPIGLNWIIKNTGFTDNIERNQGHYYVLPTGEHCKCPGPPPPPPMFCVGPPKLRDSTGQGSSYWLDRVYISSDPSGLDISNAKLLFTYQNGTKQNSGQPNQPIFMCGRELVNTNYALLPNRSFANSANFSVPQDLVPGTYYIYVYTNPTKTVFEYPGTAEIKRTGPIVIERPDIVAAMNAPANAVAGTPVQIEYAISNNGPGNVYSHLRVDQLYVSNNPVFDGTAKLVATKTNTENVLTGTPVTHSVQFILHPSQSGTRYFFVKTNTAHSFAETDTTNNLSAAGALVFAAAAPVDLIVSEVSIPDTVLAGVNSYWQYTITNNGSGAGVGVATDSFFVSCNPVFSPATSFYVGKKEKTRNISPGASVTDTFSTVLPFTFQLGSCFPNDEFNNAYFFVKTNATDNIYEGANSANNTTAGNKRVIKNMLVDLQVNNVNAQLSAIVGRPYSISYTIQNVGKVPQIGYDYSVDSVYISVDSVLSSNAVPFGGVVWGSEKPIGAKVLNKTLNRNFVNVPSGDYYVFVKTNAQIPSHILAERNFSNNVNLIRDGAGKAQKISVVRPPLPDLVDSIMIYPAMASPGQPITVIHRIKNIGEGESYPNNFIVQLWLSDDPQGNRETHFLRQNQKNVIIPAGGFVDDTLQAFIPKNTIARNYSLVTSLDGYNDVVEGNELNNRSVVFINIFNPDPVDLVITFLQAVDTVLLGYGLDSVRYIVKNSSGNPAVGYTSDGFYLSTSGVFDSSAVLIGIKEKNINMQPLALDTLTFSPIISGVTEGSYNLFVNTDLTNTIPETNETNNTAMVATPVYVKVKELRLGELELNTLGGYYRYYKLIIPDSLNGATISVKLVSEDSLTKVNQMFIGKGYVPDAAHFDYTYPTANYGNQDVIMDYTTAGTYYISFRCINPGYYLPQNVTLKARKLPFEISSIQSATGGNIGNVTVKISGALFTEGMTAKLNKSGTEITASRIYFTNTTIVYATFNLQGKSLGIYDLTLSKGDTSFAVLNNSFSVVKADNGGLITGSGPNTGAGDGTEPGCDPGAASGLNSQLVTELVVPEKVFAGWSFAIQINFKNPTNYDIPAQVRTLYTENIIKLGLTPESTINGVHSLTLELTETDGPPGVLRAGGSGTILIYGRSIENVAGHTKTPVHLK